MKKILVVLFLSLSVLYPRIAISQADIKEGPKGFRGIDWNAKLDAIPDMIYRGYDSNNKDVNWYARKNEKMELGTADLKNIYYLFFKDRFYRGLIEFNGKANYAKIDKALRAAYGRWHSDSYSPLGKTTKHESDRYYVFDNGATITLGYKEDCLLKLFCDGDVQFNYTPLIEEVKKDTENKKLKVVDTLKKDLE